MQDELLALERAKRWHARMADQADDAIARLLAIRMKIDSHQIRLDTSRLLIKTEIRKLRASGWRLKELSSRFGFSTSGIFKICKTDE